MAQLDQLPILAMKQRRTALGKDLAPERARRVDEKRPALKRS